MNKREKEELRSAMSCIMIGATHNLKVKAEATEAQAKSRCNNRIDTAMQEVSDFIRFCFNIDYLPETERIMSTSYSVYGETYGKEAEKLYRENLGIIKKIYEED